MSGYLKNLAQRSLAAPSLHPQMRLPFNGDSGFEPAVQLGEGTESRALEAPLRTVEEGKAPQESPVKARASVPPPPGREKPAPQADREAGRETAASRSNPQTPDSHEPRSGRAYPALLPPLPEGKAKSQEPSEPVEPPQREESLSPEGLDRLPVARAEDPGEREFKPLVKTAQSPKPVFTAPSHTAAGLVNGPRAREAQGLPDIHVSIGRIELSAVTAAPAPKRAPANGVKIMSLQEYEEKRRGRAR